MVLAELPRRAAPPMLRDAACVAAGPVVNRFANSMQGVQGVPAQIFKALKNMSSESKPRKKRGSRFRRSTVAKKCEACGKTVYEMDKKMSVRDYRVTRYYGAVLSLGQCGYDRIRFTSAQIMHNASNSLSSIQIIFTG